MAGSWPAACRQQGGSWLERRRGLAMRAITQQPKPPSAPYALPWLPRALLASCIVKWAIVCTCTSAECRPRARRQSNCGQAPAGCCSPKSSALPKMSSGHAPSPAAARESSERACRQRLPSLPGGAATEGGCALGSGRMAVWRNPTTPSCPAVAPKTPPGLPAACARGAHTCRPPPQAAAPPRPPRRGPRPRGGPGWTPARGRSFSAQSGRRRGG